MIDKATLRQKNQTDKVDYIFVFTLFVFLTGAGLFGFFFYLDVSYCRWGLCSFKF